MAGLEVIVRPVVFPDIRPKPARMLPPVDDPTKGFCTIHGNPANQIGLSSSYTFSMSASRSTETERRVDVGRVSQMDDDGTIHEENFIDIQVANRINTNKGKKPNVGDKRNAAGQLVAPDGMTVEEGVEYYRKLDDKLTGAPNIKLTERDKMIRTFEQETGAPIPPALPIEPINP